MDNLFHLLVPLIRLVSSIAVVILFFLFVVRPLINYFITNREIEHRKRIYDDGTTERNESQGEFVRRRNGTEEDETEPAEEVIQSRDKKLSDLETLNRLSASDPEKASDLVKKWVNDT